MDIFEIAGYRTGVSRSGVNYLQPSDSFQNIINGYIYRQVLQSRRGFKQFAPRLADQSRIFGIFDHDLVSGEKDLLVTDKNFLYKYNTGTDVFDQIPFGGSLVGYTGFNIIDNDQYISGITYPTKDNLNRFLFTGEGITKNPALGGSAIFYYDGVNVKDFVLDNPDFQDYAGGAIERAAFLLYFGERLNLVLPYINGNPFQQGMLYSGIRTVSGDGDKFNVPGSGLLQADTSQNINGVEILGQVISLHFNRSNYVIEKTQDAFNPYFIRKVPSVLGTNAKFSTVQWNDVIRTIGKNGVLGTDGRQTLRVDDKIPYFTAQEINQNNFNLTYGGFDRQNNMFLWTYQDASTDLLTQNKVLVGNYEEDTWSVYDMRFSVFGQSDVGINLVWDQINAVINPSWNNWNNTTDLWDEIGIEEGTQKTLAGDDLGFIYEVNKDYDDYFTAITAVAIGTTTTLTVDPSAFQAGDLVAIQDVEGMIQLNNYFANDEALNVNFNPWLVLSATPTLIEINTDSLLYDPYISGGSIVKVIEFSAETIPFNPYRSIGRRCFISHIEFLIDVTGGFLKVDIYADEQETPYKQNILCYPTATAQAREYITVSVDNEANFHTIVMKQISPAVQLRITSVRIHCKPGGLTSG